MKNVMLAADLEVGDQLAEGDGFLFEITEIVKRTRCTITVRFHSDFSSFKEHWHDGPGIVRTFRKPSELRGLKKENATSVIKR